LLQRELVDALHHVHVAPLAFVLRARVIAIRLEVPAVNHHVHVREEGLQRRVVVREQIGDLDAFDAITRCVHVPDVDEPEVVAFPESREELAGYVARCARQQYTRAPLCSYIVRLVKSQA
jgi:hypothetical protein